MSMYVGMDVHRKRTQVAILEEDRTEVLNRNLDNDHADLTSLLADLPPGTPAVFEAGYGWSWVAELLEELQFDAHMAHPCGCKAIASARLKNDRVDARTLAHLLRRTCWRRRGWRRRRYAISERCSGTEPRWSAPERG